MMSTWNELVPFDVYEMKAGRTFSADDLDEYLGVVLCRDTIYRSLEAAIDWNDETDTGILDVDCWYFGPIREISPYMDEQFSEFGLDTMVDVPILKAMLARHQADLSKWHVPPLLTVWKCKWWQCNGYLDPTEWDAECYFEGFLSLSDASIEHVELRDDDH